MVKAAVKMEAQASGLKVSSEELQAELVSMMKGYDGEGQYYAAMKEQLGLTPDQIREDAEERLLLGKIAVQIVNVTESEVDAYIAENDAQFVERTQLRVSWIKTATAKEAEDVLRRLEAGEDFALMANAYSIDSATAADGGDLGYMDADDPLVDQRVLEAANRLDVGQSTGPVEVDGGEAILKLTEKKTDRPLDEEQQRLQARTEIAFSKLDGQRAVEDRLLVKYDAVVVH